MYIRDSVHLKVFCFCFVLFCFFFFLTVAPLILEADLYIESFANIAEANMVSVITSSQYDKCI